MKKFVNQYLLPVFFGVLFTNNLSAQNTLKQDPPSLTMLFAGDITLDGKPGEMISNGKDPFAPISAILKDADIRIGNLECVVATTGKPEDKNFVFRAHPTTLPVLKQYFDAISLANNHSGDFGPQAFTEMLTLLRKEKMAYFGGGTNLAEAHQPLIFQRKGIRIAVLGYNEFMPRSYEAGIDTPGVAWSEDEQVVRDIQMARQHADIVIPFMHWGWEGEPKANQRQRELSQLMINAGADAVIGAHPHVTQDVEIYRGKPIIYSLGNFLFDSLDTKENTEAWMLALTLTRNGVQRLEILPVKLNMEGVPHAAPNVSAPCWNKGDVQVATCHSRL